ncbi:uncharacterized protein LOC127123840 [Lathyrus oleraceus]|uniref:uncharacterized protein LOC127123840 n=1 Tax=Pisum sativum TaxID=3888 RepID=UPI0021D01962|nr:uncharacterized protein LOC127123840 [Pisum sativum]
MPNLTNNSAAVWRKQMDERNHDMVQMLTQMLTTVLNPLIQNTAQSNQQMTTQMAQMADFLGVPQPHRHPLRDGIRGNQGVTFEEDPTINQIPQNQLPPEMQIRHDDMVADNNLAAMVERIMARNEVNFGLRRPNYTSPLSEYILQTDTLPRTKIPKFTKFFGDTTESTIEHVARYIIEAGDISNNESLRITYFPSSLTKNAFTWFTTLPQNSVHTWNQLERMSHEQFYMGQTKISLKELASIKRKFTEPTDGYLNRFRLLKARCFT